MARICYVHAGTHKTGTTTLQAVLSANAETLDARGFHVPLAGRPWPGSGHHNIAWELNGDPRFDSGHGNFAALLTEIAERQAPVACLSSEDFEYLHERPCQLERLRLGLAGIGYQAKIILYLRPQAEYAQSLYAELLKHGLRRPFQSFLEDVLGPGSITFAGHWIFCFQYGRLLRAFTHVFGRPNVLARLYDRRRRNSFLVDDFFGVMNVARSDIPSLRNVPALNVTSPLPDVLGLADALRMVRRFDADRRSIARMYGVDVPTIRGEQLLHAAVTQLATVAGIVSSLPMPVRSGHRGEHGAPDCPPHAPRPERFS